MYLSLFLFSCLSRKGSINVKISKREMFLKAHGANIQQWEAGLRSTKWVLQLCKVGFRHQMSTDNVVNCYKTSNFEQGTFLSATVRRFLWDNFSFVEYCGFHSLRPIFSLHFCSTPIFLHIQEVRYSPSVPWRAKILPFWSGKKGSLAQSRKVGWKIRKFVAWLRRISF